MSADDYEALLPWELDTPERNQSAGVRHANVKDVLVEQQTMISAEH